MDKRGLSGVVVVVLIILLVLAGSVIIWFFVKGFLDASHERVESGVFTVSMSLEPDKIKINKSAYTLDVSVKRNAGKAELVGWYIVLEDVNKGTKGYQYNHSLNELETFILKIGYSSSGLGELKKVSIIPIVNNTKGNPIHGFTQYTYLITGNEPSTTPAPVDPPVANFVYSPSNNFVSDLVTFSSTSSPNVINFVWNFGDGTTATGQNVQHSYSSFGVYSVNLTVMSNEYLNSSIVKMVAVQPHSVSADFSYLPSSGISALDSVTFDGSLSSANAVNFVWNFGDGIHGSGSTISHSYLSAGTYNVNLSVISNEGLRTSIVKTISIQPAVVASSCNNNGVIDVINNEQCDGSDLGAKTCFDVGYSAGNLACDSSCHFVTSNCHISISDLLIYYQFENVQNGVILDLAGHDNNGTVSGGLTFGEGRYGSAAVFNGVDSSVVANYPATEAFTISFWAKSSASGISNRIVGAAHGANGIGGASIVWGYPQNNITAILVDNDNSELTSQSLSGMYTGWHHVALTFSATSGTKLYWDGALVNQDPTANKVTPGSINLRIGIWKLSGNQYNYYTGAIDNFMFFYREIDASEVEYLYQTNPWA